MGGNNSEHGRIDVILTPSLHEDLSVTLELSSPVVWDQPLGIHGWPALPPDIMLNGKNHTYLQ